MPDLKSELEKVIHAWEQPEPEIKMETTNTPTCTQLLFEYVKANPGKTTVELEAELPHIHPQSISSILSSMLKRHLIRKVGGKGVRQFGGTYEVASEVYMSPSEQLGLGRGRRLSTKAKRKNRPVIAAVKNLPKVVAQAPLPLPAPAPVVAAPVVVPTPMPVLPTLPTAESVLNNMSVMEARRLYEEMKKLFGA